ncbi:MAG: class I SAM-dependent methyltransferase [Actinomycetota bacterium]|nr:class I SAM-dependent methyltransferase [Actinomycetota bacterium]
MTRDRGRAKKIVGGIYSFAAHRLYEPIVVRRAFPLLGGDLNELVAEQGREAVRVAAGRPILDMPVGTAYFTSAVAQAHPGLVAGVDIAEGMVRESAALARSRGLSNLVALQADAHSLPFRDGAFGAILCTNGLQVIPGLRPAVRELARVLAPGGTLFVSVVGLPLGAVLPSKTAEGLPTVLAARTKVADEMERAGLEVRETRRRRLATLFEADKPLEERPR